MMEDVVHMSTTLLDKYVGVAEAAKLLGVHPATVRRWIDAGALTAYRLGKRRVLIRTADLAGMIAPARRTARVGMRIVEQDPRTLEPLSAEERRKALAAMDAADALRTEQLARRGGKPFSPSDEILNELRDQRTRDLS